MKILSTIIDVFRVVIIVAIILSIGTLVGAVASLIYPSSGPFMSFVVSYYLGYKFAKPLMRQ